MLGELLFILLGNLLSMDEEKSNEFHQNAKYLNG